jgi:hypothetical protein
MLPSAAFAALGTDKLLQIGNSQTKLLALPQSSSMLPRFTTTIKGETLGGAQHEHYPRGNHSAIDRIYLRAGWMWSTRKSAAACAAHTSFAATDSIYQAAAALGSECPGQLKGH